MTKPTRALINTSMASYAPDRSMAPKWAQRKPTVRAKARNAHPEYDLQCGIVRWLGLQHPEILVNASIAGHTRLTMLQMIRAKKAGMLSGFPDMVLHWKPNRTIYLEIKSEKGSQTDNQIEIEAKLNHIGIPYYVVRSIEEIRDILIRELSIQ